jgi:VanZ family protein
MSLIDKWTHIVLYAVLVCVFSLEYLLSDLHFPRILLCFLTLVMPLFIGALIEVMQTTLTTYRSGDILDFVADAVGVAAGGLFAAFVISPLVSLWRPKKERRQTP